MAKTRTKVIGAAGAVVAAAAAGAVGMAVARRKGSEPELWSVRPDTGGWRLARDGDEDGGSHHATKKEAVAAGRRIAGSRAPCILVLHYADGTVQKRLTYDGKD